MGRRFDDQPMPMEDTARIGDEGKAAGFSDLPAALLSELPPSRNAIFVLSVTGNWAGQAYSYKTGLAKLPVEVRSTSTKPRHRPRRGFFRGQTNGVAWSDFAQAFAVHLHRLLHCLCRAPALSLNS